MVTQPKIDWARGWISHNQLPIVLRSPDAAKARFLPRQMRPISHTIVGRAIDTPTKPTPYAATFFFIKKKNGKLCPIQDYRPINEWTIKNCYPLPLIPQLINRLRGCTLFTKFDIKWGYNNVRIKDGDQWKAAFTTNEGLFEPTVMFFGLTNSPATFQTMMNMIFRDLIAVGSMAVYMDNMAIHTARRPNETEDDHIA